MKEFDLMKLALNEARVSGGRGEGPVGGPGTGHIARVAVKLATGINQDQASLGMPVLGLRAYGSGLGLWQGLVVGNVMQGACVGAPRDHTGIS